LVYLAQCGPLIARKMQNSQIMIAEDFDDANYNYETVYLICHFMQIIIMKLFI